MFKSLKKFFDILLDKVVWVVVYPDKKNSIKMTWSVAKDYKEIFGGDIVHCDELESQI
jgi:hypothetical protein